MATIINTDLADFYDFLGQRVQLGANRTPEASVEEFRAYQRELQRFQAEIQPAIERFHRGEGEEIDFDKLEKEVVQRLAEKGIVD